MAFRSVLRALPAIALIFTPLLGGGALAADPPRVDRIDIVGKGIYVIEAGTRTSNANAPSATITAVDRFRNVQSTTTIPARLGTEFGVEYVVVGAPEGAEVSLDIVNLYPAEGLRDPANAQPLRESRYARVKKVGETAYLGYGFEKDWELVPGTWTFQLWYSGKKLAEQSFVVTK